MDSKALAKTALFEHDMLAQIVKALHVVLQWKVEGSDLSRKLSPVRFISQSLHWHLERLMALEDSDAYREAIQEAHHDLSHDVRATTQHHEHEEFRAALAQILPRLDDLSPHDHATFDFLCEQLSALLHTLEEHIRNEQILLPEVALEDEEVLR
jgi:hemerythrin-like domain-containing protein